MNEALTYDTTGMDLTEDSESCVLHAYADPGTGAEPWTIFYGHTGPEVCPGMTGTKEDAEAALRQDIAKSEADVKRLATVELTQGQYDALVDFDFNKGSGHLASSTLLRLVNAGDFAAADNEFAKWVYGGGHKLPGLVTRAYREAQVFNA